MDRAERTGLGIAIVGHALLFGALSVSLLRPTPKLPPLNPPIDVELIDAKSLVTAAPDAVKEASAPPAAEAPPAAAPEPIAAPPPPTPIAPPTPAKPIAMPKPVAPAKALPKKMDPTPPSKTAQTPAKAPAKPVAKAEPKARTSRLGGLGAQLSQAANTESARAPGTGRGTAAQGSGTPAAKTAAQLEASFIQALFVKIKRYWRAPTGVDAELLRTQLVVTLKPDGSVGSITVVNQSGDNENNSNLKALHAERAVNAVRRAAPFDLPPEHYAIWQSLGPLTFDKRLN